MSRTEWVLGGLLALLIMLVMGMGLFLWLQPDLEIDELPAGDAGLASNPGIAPTALFQGDTAVAAFGQAQGAARTWQPDARLYSARATWPQGTPREELLLGAADWALTFYSPGEQLLLTVTVIGGAVRQDGSRPVDRALQPVDLDRWVLDSDNALALFMSAGGDVFLQEAQITTLTMALAMDTGAPRAEWLISLFAPGNGSAMTMRFDAATGDIVEIIGVPTPAG